MSNPRKRVVVTGVGAVSSMGNNADELWQSLRDYRIGYDYFSFPDASHIKCQFYAVYKPEKKDFKVLPKSILRGMPAFARYSLLASHQAMEDAFAVGGSLDETYDSTERATVLGTAYGWIEDVLSTAAEYNEHKAVNALYAVSTMHNAATAAATVNWKMRGPQLTPVGACATGATAIGEAVEMIRCGRARMAIAGGAEGSHGEVLMWSCDVLGALSDEQTDLRKASCPFSANRTGFVPASGAATVVLEEHDAAVARGARILAEVTGYACTSDAEGMTSPAENEIGRVSVIEKSIKDAGLQPENIDYINAHGTSTQLNDYYETLAIKKAFKEAAYKVPVSSTKSYTGHMIGAAGSLETVICIKAIQDGMVPATVHLDEPDEKCDLDFVANEHRENVDVNRTLNLSFGFGGINSALIVEKYES